MDSNDLENIKLLVQDIKNSYDVDLKVFEDSEDIMIAMSDEKLFYSKGFTDFYYNCCKNYGWEWSVAPIMIILPNRFIDEEQVDEIPI